MSKNFEDALAKADFRVYGKDDWEGPIDVKCHLYLVESGAFEYGNGTAMWMVWDKEGWQDKLYDTRYEKVSVKNFKEYAFEFLKSYVDKTFTVEPIE